jgi:phage terminase large subunit-like protein
VNAGERDDPHFLHVEYCAPDKATDADIDEHLDEYGKAANPAWGTIVKPSEFRADWQRSKGKPREVARFKQYRLNLWVGSTNQWLDTAGGARAARRSPWPTWPAGTATPRSTCRGRGT